MGDASPEKKSGCGILSAVFGRRTWPRRSTSTGSLPTTANATPDHFPRIPSTPVTKRYRGGSDEASFLEDEVVDYNKPVDRIIERPAPHSKTPPGSNNVYQQQQRQTPPPANYPNQGRKTPENAANLQGYAGVGRKVSQGNVGISGELDSMIADHQRSKGATNLVRASSSNVMLFGNLGNLRQGGGGGGGGNANANWNTSNVFDQLPRTAKEEQSSSAAASNGMYPNSVMGNVVKKQNEDQSQKPTSLCRAISTRMDPEQLKILGNEDYKNGRFAEALALYDAAISIDPNKASYRSNKSAALTALGRLLEAVFECREAIRIEPHYQRAHNRLATLYVRLGEAEKAIYHQKYAGAEADPDVMNKARKLKIHLMKCTDAKMQRDWNTLLRETGLSILAGADSAPQIFALKAEALLKLQRPQEADETLKNGPNFDDDECTKFLGPIGHSTILVIRAQVHLSAGRVEEAATAAQLAARLDQNNKEASSLVRKTRAVATARSKGNDLFKSGRYSEACVAYGEGLNLDPYNAVLLCNRAACRTKLGQHEKALEDCNAALNIRPSYSKARLRRSDCFAKLQKWEACIQDCEILLRDAPDDEEVGQMLKEAQSQLRRQQGDGGGGGGLDVNNTDSNGNVSSADHVVNHHHRARSNNDIIVVSSDEHFKDYVTSSGVSVVLFCNKPGDKSIIQFLEQLQKRYPSVNFLKVEVEDQPSLAKSEAVNSLPAFKVYTNGSRTKEIPGNNQDLIESTIRMHIS
ncbi:OLC1v1009233C1 [Oldenlandia corymbosa var. corymbosa]|uniref:OLC1v1009233C1 n=1 Tax=Oldenlandia corymbosa var. corymbosa TaxID=529605 RepID=A0AAV1DNE7_OLDCO|nr:OLC1v1009233C1 [Oldenlandia corymbosa var. corymbosa]